VSHNLQRINDSYWKLEAGLNPSDPLVWVSNGHINKIFPRLRGLKGQYRFEDCQAWAPATNVLIPINEPYEGKLRLASWQDGLRIDEVGSDNTSHLIMGILRNRFTELSICVSDLIQNIGMARMCKTVRDLKIAYVNRNPREMLGNHDQEHLLRSSRNMWLKTDGHESGYKFPNYSVVEKLTILSGSKAVETIAVILDKKFFGDETNIIRHLVGGYCLEVDVVISEEGF